MENKFLERSEKGTKSKDVRKNPDRSILTVTPQAQMQQHVQAIRGLSFR